MKKIIFFILGITLLGFTSCTNADPSLLDVEKLRKPIDVNYLRNNQQQNKTQNQAMSKPVASKPKEAKKEKEVLEPLPKDSVHEDVKQITRQIYDNIMATDKKFREFEEKVMKEKMIITSWYRDPERNEKAGGVKRSAHMDGLAIDFTSSNRKNMLSIYNKIKASKYSFDVLIYYRKLNLIHIGFKQNVADENRLTFVRSSKFNE